jgi:hypothetical protein
MGADEFVNLRLVDGTALALQLGHRKSIDLDLFGKSILKTLISTRPSIILKKLSNSERTIHGSWIPPPTDHIIQDSAREARPWPVRTESSGRAASNNKPHSK